MPRPAAACWKNVLREEEFIDGNLPCVAFLSQLPRTSLFDEKGRVLPPAERDTRVPVAEIREGTMPWQPISGGNFKIQKVYPPKQQ
jgi:hypothetical protein